MIRNLLHSFLILTLAFVFGALSTNVSKANCGLTISTDDTEWSFSAEPSHETTRYLTITNTSDGDITFIARLEGSEAFSVSPAHETLHKGDTATIAITFKPGANATGILTSILTVGVDGTDCHKTLKLSGTVKGTNSGGGNHIDSLIADPGTFSFGAVAAGTTVCKTVHVVNKNSVAIVVSSWHICDNGLFTASSDIVLPFTIASGASTTFTICFTPDTIHKEASCSLTVNYSIPSKQLDGKVLTLGFSGSLKGTTNGGGDHPTTSCLKIEQGDGFHDGIVLGASANRTLTLINNTGASITVTADSLGCEDQRAFSLTAQLPITIAAHSTATFSYTFTPFARSNGELQSTFIACLFLTANGDSMKCDGHYVVGKLVGYSHHDNDVHTDDTTARPMFPTEKRTLAIESNGTNPTKTFTFTNNLTVDATVKSITLQTGQFFAIQSTNPTPTPFVLHPNDVLTVTLVYTATDNLVHHDKLIIDADHALLANEFDVQGVKAATSSVRNAVPAGVEITVSPNPMTTSLTANLTGVRSATVEVYDILGAKMFSTSVANQWIWNATTTNGAHIAAGSYIVRFSGVTNDGVAFVTSKQVIVAN